MRQHTQSNSNAKKTNLGHVLSLALALVTQTFLGQVARLKVCDVINIPDVQACCCHLQSLTVLRGANLGGLQFVCEVA